MDAPLSGIVAHPEEVEVVRILDNLASEIRLRFGKSVAEVCRHTRLALVEFGLNLQLEHVTRPCVFPRFRRVPESYAMIRQLVNERQIVPPRQFANSL